MSWKRIALRLTSTLSVLLILIVGGSIALRPQTARAHLVAYSDLVSEDGRVYVQQGQTFRGSPLEARYTEALIRIETLFGDRVADPIVIFAADEETAARFGNSYGAMHAGIHGRPIVMVGPIGMKSIDIMAHELLHAEHFARVGYVNWARTPAWFIEGMGMQVDNRPAYQSPTGEADIERVQTLNSFSAFMQGDLTANYTHARLAVARLIAGEEVDLVVHNFAYTGLLFNW